MPPDPAAAVRSFGIGALDRVLPGGGLPVACVHEVGAADGSAAADGFAAAMLGRLAGEAGMVAWCGRRDGLYGPGLAAFGLDAGRLVVVRARRDTDVFWASEEALRSGGLAAVLGEAGRAEPIALRRLQLAAEAGGGTAVLLRPPGAVAAPGWTATRWRVASAASAPAVMADGSHAGPGRPRWRVALQRCKAGAPATWLLEWCDETGGLAVAADLRHRPAASPAGIIEPRRAL